MSSLSGSDNTPPKRGNEPPDAFVRRLRAVAAIDVVGYSKLMSIEESRTHARVNELFATVVGPTIKDHDGQQIERAGDGLLVLFESSTDAVRCALVIQQAAEEHQSSTELNRRLRLRIGVNVGDIIFDGDEIAGDDVNIAVRLQALAEPGSVCISASVRGQLHDELEATFEDLGNVALKNIGRPVHAYQVLRRGRGTIHGPLGTLSRYGRRRPRRTWATAMGALLLMAAIGFFATRNGSWESTAQSGPPPMSVAIMPFKLPSSGITSTARGEVTDPLTRALAATGWLQVRDAELVAQAASQSTDLADVREGLNVRYAVQGHFDRKDGQLIIEAELVDTGTRSATWNTRVAAPEGPAAASDLASKLTIQLRSAIYDAESKRLIDGGGVAQTAMEHKMLGDFARKHFYSLDDERKARKHYEDSLAIDPNFVQSVISLAYTFLAEIDLVPDLKNRSMIEAADELSKRAIARQPNSAPAWQLRAEVLARQWLWSAALDASARALAADPARAFGHAQRASLMRRLGKPVEALALTERAISLAEQRSGYVLFERCRAYMALGDYKASVEACQRSISSEEWWLQSAYLAAAYALLGEIDKASQEKARLLVKLPNASIQRVLALRESDVPEFQKQLESHLLRGLRLAGVEDGG